jgi:hypothetical protein
MFSVMMIHNGSKLAGDIVFEMYNYIDMLCIWFVITR